MTELGGSMKWHWDLMDKHVHNRRGCPYMQWTTKFVMRLGTNHGIEGHQIWKK